MSPSDPECLDADHDHIECVAQEIVGKKDAPRDIANGRAPQGQLSRPAICFRSIAVKHLALNAKGPCVGVKLGSLQGSGCEVGCFTDALSDFLKPHPWIGTMNRAAQESQLFGHVLAVVADVVFADPGVQGKKTPHAAGLGENIGGMTEFRGLNHDRLLQIEDVFGPEQIDLPGATRELAIEERVIVGTPADLHDVEVTGDVKIRAHLLEFRFFDSPVFESQTNLVQGPGVLTNAMIPLAGLV